MCKVEMLRALLNARLSAAVDEIFAVFERTLAEYEEDLSRTKDENERQRRLLDAVFMPQDEAHRADVNEEYLHLVQQAPEYPHIKKEKAPDLRKAEEELETHHIKEEEEEADIVKFPFTGVPLKSEAEDKGQREENRGMEPPSSSSSQRMTTEGDGDHCGGSQAGGRLAPLSDGDEITSHSPDTDNDEHSRGDMACHSDNKRVKCSQCDNTFFNKSSLKRHVRTHTREKPFACSVCGKTFTQTSHLTSHFRTHTGEKPFGCSVCGKKFRIKGDLKNHTRIHTGEKPFACSICDKGFTQKGHLRSHIRTHTGEKPFACSVCNLNFSERSSLRPHMRTHTGEKPYSCSVCGKTFAQRRSLTTHRRTHTGEKALSCSVCDEQFSDESEMNKHVCR